MNYTNNVESSDNNELLEFIRGKKSLGDLKSIDVEIEFQGSLPQRTILVRNPRKLSVVATPTDVAKGFLHYKENWNDASIWATVILSASDLIELSPEFDANLSGQTILEGLWDASFSEPISEELWTAVNKLMQQSLESS